jgi:hypothetical protein
LEWFACFPPLTQHATLCLRRETKEILNTSFP